MALLSYRATPLPWCGLSPAELLMGRKIRTDVPQLKSNFIPKWEHIQNFRKLDTEYRQIQKENYDRRHGVKTLPSLPDDMTVWVDIQGDQVPGRIVQAADTPRSYLVRVPSGEFRRNRAHIRARTDLQGIAGTPCTEDAPTAHSRPITRSQTGIAIHPPDRLQYEPKS